MTLRQLEMRALRFAVGRRVCSRTLFTFTAQVMIKVIVGYHRLSPETGMAGRLKGRAPRAFPLLPRLGRATAGNGAMERLFGD